MKNKKLFAILTLVCFMMTLMPVAAFAAPTERAALALPGTAEVDATGAILLDTNATNDEVYAVDSDDKITDSTNKVTAAGNVATIPAGTTWTQVVALANATGAADGDTLDDASKVLVLDSDLLAASKAAALGAAFNADATNAQKGSAFVAAYTALTATQKAYIGVAAQTTLDGYVDAYAALIVVADSMSAVWTKDTKVDVRTETAEFNLKITDLNNPTLYGGAATLYVWVTAEGSSVPVNTFAVNAATNASGAYIQTISDVLSGEEVFYVTFLAPGEYQVHVSAVQPVINNGNIAVATEFKSAGSVVKVVSANDVTKNYVIKTNVGGTIYDANDDETYNVYLEDGDTESALLISANNVDEKVVEFTLYNDDTMAMPKAGVKVDIEVVGAITTDKTSVYTNALGKAEFKVGGNRDGIYKIYLSTGKYESVIEVQVGAIIANSIESDCETGKYDILGETDFADVIAFEMFDVNGNQLDPVETMAVAQGWDKAANSDKKNYLGVDATGYVAFVEKPADSKLENEDLVLGVADDTLTIKLADPAKIDAEGTYTFKVVLNNGAFATATCEVKEFDKPVTLIINGADNVELGAVTNYVPIWIDANGVKDTQPKGVEIAATGYAVETFNGVTLETKSDEKYVGSVITLTAIDERYNLVATKEVTIAAEAQKLSFAADTAEVNVNNYIKISVVDANGKVVALDGNVKEINYVVLEKPEGANVFVSTYKDYSVKNKNFVMNLTSNKVGTVKVQAVVKYETTTAVGKNEVANVVKYYTGIQEIAVGTGEIGKSVVMSIGSNELIVGSKVETMDAKPIVQNSRTFVPFRALAEAFGATVAYDQATSAVTAELNGVKVVMTVGAPVYTVNGVEKNAGVAPFISDSRTFVPVRFAAEAFGIEVVPTYNTDGSVADVLFNM